MKECPFKKMQPEMEQYHFIHFNTTLECDLHIRNNKHVTVAYKCCDGKGYASLSKNRIYAPIHCSQDIFIPIEGTCDICFLEETTLYNTCTTCSHPFCKDCLTKIASKICPYCRGKLKNNF